MIDTSADLIREAHEWFVTAEFARYAGFASILLILIDVKWALIPVLFFMFMTFSVWRSGFLILRHKREQVMPDGGPPT